MIAAVKNKLQQLVCYGSLLEALIERRDYRKKIYLYI